MINEQQETLESLALFRRLEHCFSFVRKRLEQAARQALAGPGSRRALHDLDIGVELVLGDPELQRKKLFL
jgi:hypothetical protein